MAGAASVNLQEIDLSTRVPSFPGVSGGIVVPTKKGLTEGPQLVTNDAQFLSVFTPDETVKVGFDLGHFSALAFLEKSDKLWVQRAIKDAFYSGASVKTLAASTPNQALPSNQMMADPSAYVFDSNEDVAAVAQVVTSQVTQIGSFFDVVGAAKADRLWDGANAQHDFWYNVTDGANSQVDPVLGGTAHQVDILAADTAIQVAAKLQAVIDAQAEFGATVATDTVTTTNAVAGVATAASGSGTSTAHVVTVTGAAAVDLVDEALLIHANSQGAYGDLVGFKLTNNATDPDKVPEVDSFLLEVFRSDNQQNPIETFVCSRIVGKKDGFGRNIFVDDVLQASNYVRGISNPAIAETITPKDQATILFMAGGSDGIAVTDTEMVSNAQLAFSNKDKILVTLLMDGGFTTAAYQQALDAICQGRQDSVALLSSRFADENTATYITDIVNYRKTTLNLNSSYSALYTPHVKISDRFNDREIFVAPDGYAAAAISETASSFELWFPPAGFKRGLINVLDVKRRFTNGEMTILYNAGINPIRFKPGKGIVIWGQKTLSSRPSALDRLNIRLLLIVIEPSVLEALEDFLFDLNDEATRAEAVAKIEPFMERIQARRGVTDFRVVSDDTNNSAEDIDNNRMVVDLFIKPTRSIEEIPFRVVIVSTGVSFDSAQTAV
jgi:hypothetical protein